MWPLLSDVRTRWKADGGACWSPTPRLYRLPSPLTRQQSLVALPGHLPVKMQLGESIRPHMVHPASLARTQLHRCLCFATVGRLWLQILTSACRDKSGHRRQHSSNTKCHQGRNSEEACGGNEGKWRVESRTLRVSTSRRSRRSWRCGIRQRL